MLTTVISGAQTGADQAGLAAAVSVGLKVGGLMPLGRRTEDGPLDPELFRRWKLIEHPSTGYSGRTEQNVRWADGTVIFGNQQSPGCRLTRRLCEMHGKPVLSIPRHESHDVAVMLVQQFILSNNITVLNVAGNRESTNPGIYAWVFDILVEAFDVR